MEENIEQIVQKQRKKQTRLMILGIAILVIGLIGITYAFFNYTRTGTANVIKTGRISFNSNQTETINLTNVFPIDSSDVDNDTTNVDEAVITITGDTTYTEGIEYLISATNVSNTVGTGANAKTVPISVQITATNGLGLADASYYDNRGDDSSIYKILASDAISNDGNLVVGYITNGVDGVNGSISIKAYLDKDRIAISDTYDASNLGTDNMGTTSEWVGERTVLTTNEWNALQTNGVSFKVKIEANEGIWVEAPAAPVVSGTIVSCPNCVFKYTTDWLSYGEYGDELEAGDYSTNYHDVISDSGKNYFLGLVLDSESGRIDRAYACGIKGSTPFCIEGSNDYDTPDLIANLYTANKNILQGPTLWNNTCSEVDDGNSTYTTTCSGAINVQIQSNNGIVEVSEDVNNQCMIYDDGDIHCIES